MSFSELGVSSEVLERLQKSNISNPTSIQSESYPKVMGGTSLLGCAKTGTGKTLAYLLPLVHRFSEEIKEASPQTRLLILVPTRELASQVHSTLKMLTEKSESGAVIVGGESEDAQVALSKRAIAVIATPGRLLDLLRRRAIDLSGVKVVVFDEADRLLDMGFVDDMRAIMRLLANKELQLLFYSATVHFGIEEMAYEFGVTDLIRVGTESDELTVEGLDHRVAFVGDREKGHALVHFLISQGEGRGIVFSNYRDRAHDISINLRKLGCESEVLTAQLSQGARTKIMDAFRAKRVKVLVASDLAARGLDVTDLDFVVNFDLPDDPATYVHRVGRTARAGKKGMALSFVGFEDSFRLDRLEKFLGRPIERYQFTPDQLDGPFPRLGPEIQRSMSSEIDEMEEGRTADRPRQQPHRAQPHGRPEKGRHQDHKKQHGQHPERTKMPHASGHPKQDHKGKMEHLPIPAVASRPSVWIKIWQWFGSLFGLASNQKSHTRSHAKGGRELSSKPTQSPRTEPHGNRRRGRFRHRNQEQGRGQGRPPHQRQPRPPMQRQQNTSTRSAGGSRGPGSSSGSAPPTSTT